MGLMMLNLGENQKWRKNPVLASIVDKPTSTPTASLYASSPLGVG
jgi:hypothetical protein